jgi:outer membrane protein OmpA-like peptidoglycan-associated protein
VADTLRPEWLSYQAGRWIGVWGFDGKAPSLSFLASGGVWNEFPYPINQPGVVPKRLFIIDNDSLLVIGTKGDSAVFNFLRLRQATSGSMSTRVKLGEFTMFYETSQSAAPSVAKPVLNPDEKSSSVVPNEQSVGTERTKKKGRFAVMFDTFKNADDAYALLNGLIGKFPDAYAVDTKEGIAVMGPNRMSLASIQADSSRAASSGIGVKKLVRYADKLKERKETLVTLQVYDDGAKTPVPFTLVFFNRGTDRIIFTDTVRTGKVNFIYSHGAELGVAISSPGFFPQSLRLNPAMAPVATHYFHDMFMKPLVAKDPLNPNRMVVQTASLDFQNVLFDFNQDVPRRISFVEINAMKEALSGLDSLVLVVEGHTDDIGSDAYNLALGQRRAAYVASEIQKVLRSTASLSSVSKGESMPVAHNDNDFHRSLNRRVTLKVTGGGKVVTPLKPEAANSVAIEEVMKEAEAEEPTEEVQAEANPAEVDVEVSLNEPKEIEVTEAQPVLATSSEPTAKKAIKTPNKNVKPKKDSQTPKSNSKVDKKVKSEQDKIAKFEAEKAKEATAKAKKAKELKEAEDLKKAKEAAEQRKEADKAKKKAEKEQKKVKN